MNRLALSCLLLSVVVVWGWTFVLVKDAVAVYGVIPFLAVRFLIGSVCIGLFAAPHATRKSLATGGLIGIVLAAAYFPQTLGLDLSTATNTGLITGLFVIFAPVANRLLFGVRTQRILWAAIGVSLIGLALLSGAGQEELSDGDLITLGAAACFGLHVALLDRYSKQHRADVLALGQVAAAAIIFTAAWLLSGPLVWPPAEVWPTLLVTGCIATAAAFFIQTCVQQRLSAVQTALIILTEPIFAAVFGVLLHDDPMTALKVFGAVLMVAAMFFAELYPLLRERAAKRGQD